jgi:hypothetical protein
MSKSDTQTVARLLTEYAHRTALRGGNPYRSKAYLKAADSPITLSQPLDRIIAAGTLTDIPGIGDALADIITKIHKTGSHPSLEKLRKEVPKGVLEQFAIPGLRPEKILKLYQELGISSLAELEAAAKHPNTTILGHMTGRQLQRRPGYDIDINNILEACAEYGVAVEINAHPWRLDLDWRWHQKALDYGCILSINPDAHSIRELDHIEWGVKMARKGGVPRDRVLNAMPLPKLLCHLTKQAARRPSRSLNVPMKESAGLLLYRRHHGDLEVLLGHPGGPFWRGKEEGAWTIPKGLIAPDETALAAATAGVRRRDGLPAAWKATAAWQGTAGGR